MALGQLSIAVRNVLQVNKKVGVNSPTFIHFYWLIAIAPAAN